MSTPGDFRSLIEKGINSKIESREKEWYFSTNDQQQAEYDEKESNFSTNDQPSTQVDLSTEDNTKDALFTSDKNAV